MRGKEADGNSLKRSCLGALYLDYSEAVKKHAGSKSQKLQKKICELGGNTRPVYSNMTIDMNQVCPNQNWVMSKLIQSGKAVMVSPGFGTAEHVISADESEIIKINTKSIDWARELVVGATPR